MRRRLPSMSKMPPENFQSALQLRQSFSQGPDFHGGRCAENSTNRATRARHRRKRRVYEIEWSAEAEADRQSLPVFAKRRVASAIEQLVHQAETETRNRKRIRKRLGVLTEAEWNLRIGDFRALYRIVDGRTVQILRVIIKGTATTDDALTRVKR